MGACLGPRKALSDKRGWGLCPGLGYVSPPDHLHLGLWPGFLPSSPTLL